MQGRSRQRMNTSIDLKNQQQVSLRIAELDCAEEVRQLKERLLPLAGINDLNFDVIQAKMVVKFDATQLSIEKIIAEISQLGMTATVAPAKAGKRQNIETTAADRTRERYTIRAAAFMVVAVAVHYYESGSMLSVMSHSTHSHQPGENIIGTPITSILLYLVSIYYGIRFVFPKAISSVRRLRADMNLLMVVAVIGAIMIGQWFEAAMVTFLFALSLLLEQWSMNRARRSISALMELTPETASCRCCEDELVEKSVDVVTVDTICVVKPGERIPLDGIIVIGSTAIDQSTVTGESIPVAKTVDDVVYAGTINGQGAIDFRVTHSAGDTVLDRIIHLVEEAQSHRAPSQQWVETFAAYYTPSMMLLAAVVMFIPPLYLGFTLEIFAAWFYSALVLLVIACPCALVIATPVSIVSGLTSAARHGVLIKGGLALENAAKIKSMVLDKTGTLTYGKPEVTKIETLDGLSETEILQIAVSLESISNHPLAVAIVEHAKQQNIEPNKVTEFHELPGQGATGKIDDKLYLVGSRSLLNAHSIPLSEIENNKTFTPATTVYVANNHGLLGVIYLEDQLRENAKSTIRELHALGIRPIAIISGDHERSVSTIANQLDVDQHVSQAMPEQKLSEIDQLHQQTGNVAMVGDGVNDSPALAAADLGIAMGTIGSDAAIEAADIALMSDDISKLPWLIRHAKRTVRMIGQNIAFALVVKALFVLLALFGYTNLWMAIIADTGVSLLVIANSLRLLKG
ncbi:MAG: heavy metal translocating P-type ATPase [Blastopirellula sp.]|nr:MAG: heavy metal translocating P-type ATPase [Blastopirellula sp.]